MYPEILGLGEVCVDWVAIVDHFPEPDEKIDSKSQNLFSGGVTANFITAAARLGAKAGFFGAIGKDEQGEFLRKDFISEKVDISYLAIKENQKTPVNFIFVVEQTGEKCIIQSPFMHTTIPEMKDLTEEMFKGVKILHTTGIYYDICLNAFEMAKRQKCVISFDLEKQIAIQGLDKLKPLLEQVDILLPNKAGAMQLTNTTTPIEAAKKFLAWGIKTVVITLGDQGSIAMTREEEVKTPAFKVKPIDTTGAGDTFCAAFDYAYVIKKMPLKDSCLFANAASALKIQNLGARNGMPSIGEIKKFLAAKKVKLTVDL